MGGWWTKEWKPLTSAEANPIGDLKHVNAADISGDGPMVIGKAPLPPCMQGLFWMTWQGSGSCLASLGG